MMPMSDDRHPEEAAEDDVEPFMLYRDYGLNDADMDLLLELALISPMTGDPELAESLADTLETVHPHHAGAFIVRGLAARAVGAFDEAAEMFVTGAQARFKAEESAALCLRMLQDLSMAESDLAHALRDMLDESDKGRRYLAASRGAPPPPQPDEA